MIRWFLRQLQDRRYRRTWRQVNTHNFTFPVGRLPLDRVSVDKSRNN